MWRSVDLVLKDRVLKSSRSLSVPWLIGERNAGRTPGRIITRYKFSQLFGKTWVKGMSMQNIIAGFRITRVYHFDRSVLLPKESKRVSLADKTGLKFIPLYSPAYRQPSQSSARVSHFSPEEIADIRHALRNVPSRVFVEHTIQSSSGSSSWDTSSVSCKQLSQSTMLSHLLS